MNKITSTLLILIGFGHHFLDAQSLFLSPVIEFKNALHIVDNKAIEGPEFTYVPEKINYRGIAPINLGLHLEYRFKNENAASFGLMQDHPQMGYQVHFFSYDSVYNLYSANSAGMVAAANSWKIPFTFSFKLSDQTLGKTVIQKSLLISAALYGHKSNRPISQNDFGATYMDSVKYISVSSTHRAYTGKYLMFTLAYSWQFKVRDRELFNFTVFADYSPFKVLHQSVNVFIHDGTQSYRYNFRNSYSASGFGFRLSTPIRIWKPKVFEPYQSKLSNEQ